MSQILVTRFLITYEKTLTKNLSAVHPEKVTRMKKRKKTRKAIAKLFALNANAKIYIIFCTNQCGGIAN